MSGEIISLGARLSQLAAQRPHRPAVSDQVRTVTWGELDRRTNRIARGLEAAGVRAGDLVTVGLPNSVDFVEACFGLWKAGRDAAADLLPPAGPRGRGGDGPGGDADPDRQRHHRKRPAAL